MQSAGGSRVSCSVCHSPPLSLLPRSPQGGQQSAWGPDKAYSWGTFCSMDEHIMRVLPLERHFLGKCWGSSSSVWSHQGREAGTHSLSSHTEGLSPSLCPTSPCTLFYPSLVPGHANFSGLLAFSAHLLLPSAGVGQRGTDF